MSRILCISHSSLNAGAEKAFSEMVKALSLSGHSVVCIFPSEGPLINKCLPAIESYIILTLPWWFGSQITFKGKLKLIYNLLISSIKIRRYIISNNIQRVIVNTIAIPSPAIAAFFSPAISYWFLHEIADDGFSLVFGERFSKKLIGIFSHRVICNSKYTLSHYQSFISSKKLTYAYQSVDIEIAKKIKPGTEIIFGLIGRLCEQKAQKEAVEALILLREEPIKLWLIGACYNDYAEGVKRFITENNLGEKIIFTGEVNNIASIYAGMDVLIACSRKEALGRTTIEAMKCGLPVIAPDAFGHRELIQDGIDGFFYELGNAADLAVQMQKLKEGEYREKLGANGKKRASKQFNGDRFAEMLGEIII